MDDTNDFNVASFLKAHKMSLTLFRRKKANKVSITVNGRQRMMNGYRYYVLFFYVKNVFAQVQIVKAFIRIF